MARTRAIRYLRSTGAGDLRELDETQGAANTDTTIARYVLGGLTTDRQYRPAQTTSANTALPAAGANPPNKWGWLDDVSQFTNGAQGSTFTFSAQTWDIRLFLKRSGQALEVDQQADTTVVVHRFNSADTWQAEVGRATVRHTYVTAGAEVTFTFAPGAQVFNDGDQVAVFVYVTTLAAGLPAAPAVATDLIVRIDSNAATASRQLTLSYTLQYRRVLSPIATGVATLTRKLTLHRVPTVAAVGVATLKRTTKTTKTAIATGVATMIRKTKHILPTVVATGVATLIRKTKVTKTATAVGVATLARLLDLHRTLSAAVTGVATLGRKGRYKRTLSVAAVGVARGFVKIPFELLPPSGGPTDFSGSDPSFTIAGIVRDGNGNTVSGVTVRLMRESDHFMADETTSAANGSYSFVRDSADPNTYYVVGHKSDDVTLHGTSRRDLDPS